MSTGELEGRVAIVTGAGRGIGLGVALRLAEAEAAVVVFDVAEDRVATAVERIRLAGGVALGIVGDVTRAADFDRAVRTASEQLGTVDILVNNAGTWVYKPTVDHSEEDFDRTIAVNLKGTFLGCRAVLPGMMRARWGRIVNVASIAAFHYTMPHVAYAAAKAGIVAMTREIAYEAAPFGVTVNAIAPGSIPPTEPLPEESVPSAATAPPRGLPIGPGSPRDIAEVVAFLASERARYVVGITIPVAGGADLAVTFGRLEQVRESLLPRPT